MGGGLVLGTICAASHKLGTPRVGGEEAGPQPEPLELSGLPVLLSGGGEQR